MFLSFFISLIYRANTQATKKKDHLPCPEIIKRLGSRQKEQIKRGEVKERGGTTKRAMVVEGTPQGAINIEAVISKEVHLI